MELPRGENATLLQNHRGIPASFSSRLRRRFSRESRQSADHRIIFPFSLKSKPSTPKTATDLAVFGDHGSSLMNAQGYDSDAQCIGTPQHVENVKSSPKTPTFRKMGLNHMIERSRESNNLEPWASPSGQNQSDAPGASFGMHFIPTPPGSMRGPSGAHHVKHATEGTGSRSMPLFNHSLGNKRSGEQSTFAKSLPSLHVSQEELIPQSRNNYQSRVGLSGSSGENLQSLAVGWAQYMDSNHNDYGAGSSESLTKQTPEIMVPKRRHPTGCPKTHSEAHPSYPDGFDLSHKLAGSNMASGPPSANPSVSDLPRANRYGLRIPKKNIRSCETSGTSTIVGSGSHKQEMLHKRDVSSFYSRPSDETSGRASPAVYSLRVHAANAIDRLPNIHRRMGGEASFIEDGQEPTEEVIRSKFVDRLEAAKSESLQPRAMGSPRKVSPGWMTDGRRMGYGYSLVHNLEESPSKAGGNDNPLSNGGWDDQTPEPIAGAVHKHGLNGSPKQRSKLKTPTRPITPDGDFKRSDSRCSPIKLPTNPNDEPILTPSVWAKIKSHSIRGHGHHPLAADLAGEGMSPANPHRAGSVHNQHGQSPTPASVDCVEDTNGNFLSRWSRANLLLKKQPQADKKDDPNLSRHSFTPETSPIADRRFSMDQTNGRPSVYFDPSNERSADKLNGQPSRSRSGRWILRFSRNRESKKRAYLLPKVPSQGCSVQYEECVSVGLERANSTRSDMAADLANEYQECIQMPGAFYGSRWASRTSLVVEAE